MLYTTLFFGHVAATSTSKHGGVQMDISAQLKEAAAGPHDRMGGYDQVAQNMKTQSTCPRGWSEGKTPVLNPDLGQDRPENTRHIASDIQGCAEMCDNKLIIESCNSFMYENMARGCHLFIEAGPKETSIPGPFQFVLCSRKEETSVAPLITIPSSLTINKQVAKP